MGGNGGWLGADVGMCLSLLQIGRWWWRQASSTLASCRGMFVANL